MPHLSKKSAPSQTFIIKPSSLLLKWLVLMHLLAILTTLICALSFSYQAIIIILILGSLWFYAQQGLKKHEIAIRYSSAFGWEIAVLEHNFFSIEILPSTVITAYLIILHYKTHKKYTQTSLIIKDTLNEDEFRKLKVLLRITGTKRIAHQPKKKDDVNSTHKHNTLV